MALIKFVSAFLAVAATAVTAVPTSSDLAKREDVDAFERGLGETIVFKRDDVLTPRDLELANLHGVNVSESEFPSNSTSIHAGSDKTQCGSTR